MEEGSITQPQLKNDTLCKVCGDKASGKHYGVPSCDGCRGFFKRSIRRNLEYVCKENGRCVVDVTRRNQCQACRFKKCLQVNMKRDAVQHERAPRSVQPGFHNHHHHYGLNFTSKLRGLHNSNFFSKLQIHSSAILEPGTPIVPTQYLHQGLVFPSVLNTYPANHTLFTNNLNATNMSYLQTNYSGSQNGTPTTTTTFLRQSSSVNSIKEDEVSSSEEAKTDLRESSLENSYRLELPTIGENTTKNNGRLNDTTYMSLYSIENIYESAAKLLFFALKWARTIPSFLQLSGRDQSILLEESWNELFILTAAQWNLPIDDISNAVTHSSRQEYLEEDARKLRDIINRLNLLRVDHTEHACLKALVLFKSECRGLCEPIHVELLQDQTHVMLHEYCIQKAGTHKGRFGKLLLSLPAVQAVSKKGLEELLFKQTVGDISVDRILTEIAKIPSVITVGQHT